LKKGRRSQTAATARHSVFVASVYDRRRPTLTQRRYIVDEFVGTFSQGRRSSPAGADANPGLLDLNPFGIARKGETVLNYNGRGARRLRRFTIRQPAGQSLRFRRSGC